MKKTVVCLSLVWSLGVAALGLASDAPAPVRDTPEALVTPTEPAATPESLFLPEASARSCSAVCGSFHAPSYGDCSDTNCYAMGCGAPNGWGGATCTCYCSYCF